MQVPTELHHLPVNPTPTSLRDSAFVRVVRHVASLLLFFALFTVALTARAGLEDSQRSVIATGGDTFASIALREFGSSGFGRMIAEYNGKNYTTTLQVGETVSIPVTMAPGNESTRVVFAKGNPIVFVRGDRKLQRSIKVGTDIYPNDVIKTGAEGYVSLRVPSGTTVSVQPNSFVRLVELDCKETKRSCKIELNSTEGVVNARVRRRNGQATEFTVETPHAVAAVRGTVFDVDSSSEELLVGVTEGELDLQAQGKATSLTEGLAAKTVRGQPPSPPVSLLPIPSFRRLPTRRVSFEDTIAWYPLDNADRYVLSVFRDELSVEVLYQAVLTETSHQLPALETGQYFLNLRGVDADGFKGFRTQVPLPFSAVTESSESVATLTQIRGDQGFIVSVENPDDAESIYELQLSDDSEFLESTSVDVTGDGGILVNPSDTPMFVRARSVPDDTSVGRFGPVLELPIN